MPDGIASLPRDVLSRALGGDLRAVRAFEQEAANSADTSERLASQADATQAINEATVLVLSANATFTNERILRVGRGISAVDDGTYLTLRVSDDVPHVLGGFPVNLTATQATNLLLPTQGQVATTGETETLSNKRVEKPTITTWGTFADDAAASAGGCPIGGIYDAAGALRVRKT